ncbi:MAG: hypothetical protein ABIG61_01480 [Planctomycetota bacterium]
MVNDKSVINKPKKCSIPAALSFYGAVHMSELPSSKYWLDPDEGNLMRVTPLWEWEVDDPRKKETGYQPQDDKENEEYWLSRYPFAFDLIPLKGKPVFPLRVIKNLNLETPVIKETIKIGLNNAFLAEFWAERFCTYPDLPEIWCGDNDTIKQVRQAARQKQNELEKKLAFRKKQGLSGIVNLNIVSFLQGIREFHEGFVKENIDCFSKFRATFFEKYPQANPCFHGYGNEYDVPTTICPEHHLYLRLVESQIKELLTACPSLEYIELTIGDNSGYVNCANPEHRHPEYCKNSVARIEKSIEVINCAYRAAQSVRPITILCRCWGATHWMIDEKHIKKYGLRLPKDNLILTGVQCAPPSIDACAQSEKLNPGLVLWPKAAFICCWGESNGVKNVFPMMYLYSNPEKIRHDMKVLSQSGRTEVVIANVDYLFTQEIDALTLRASCWNPDFDLSELKGKWARRRFGKAWEIMLDTLEQTPELYRRFTLYHAGLLERFSLHLVLWGGVRSEESIFHVPAPRWLADVTEDNFQQLADRIDPRPLAQMVLDMCKKAKRIEPDNDLVDLFISQAELTMNLACFYWHYHMSFLEYRLAEWFRGAGSKSGRVEHLRHALTHIEKSREYTTAYLKDVSLRWVELPSRRYFVFFSEQVTDVIRYFLDVMLAAN